MPRFPRTRRLLVTLALCTAAAATAVGQSVVRTPARANVTRGCVRNPDSNVDQFPDKVTVEDAVNFDVSYHRSYKVIRVKEAYPGTPPERYVLVQCGTPPPALTGELTGAQVVVVPIASMFALSPTHLSLLDDLDRMDVLTGVGRADIVTSAAAHARITAGQATQFAGMGLVMDVERVIAAKPSVLMTGGTADPGSSVIRGAGVPVVSNTEWLEPTALARAEWLKYMAAFLNEEATAQRLYGEMKARYRALSQRANAPGREQPLVMTGRSSRGIFTIAGGRSYVAALIRDAGGRYVWADNQAAGSAHVDFEAQLQRAAQADVWINGGGWPSLPDMLENEPRYAEFKAYRQGQVWVYERRLTASGGNDYWSRSVTHPDLVLADLVKIFHPRLSPQHVFEWYVQVPSR